MLKFCDQEGHGFGDIGQPARENRMAKVYREGEPADMTMTMKDGNCWLTDLQPGVIAIEAVLMPGGRRFRWAATRSP